MEMNVPEYRTSSPGTSPKSSRNFAQPEEVLTNQIESCKSVNAK